MLITLKEVSMSPQGGSEILAKNLGKYLGLARLDLDRGLNFTMSCFNAIPDKFNVVWQHLFTDQANVQFMLDAKKVEAINKFIYVSNWQLDQFKAAFPLAENCDNRVIRNAIEPIAYMPKPTTGKIQLVYSSMPDRGLSVLLDVLDILNRDDIEVQVFSSNRIYGLDYVRSVGSRDDALIWRAQNHRNVNYRGYAMNNVVRATLQKSHILAYPSIFKETSCLSVIEGLAAGCKIVATNLGALPETCSSHGMLVGYDPDHKLLAEAYAEELGYAIDNPISEQERSSQAFITDLNYSWQYRIPEWTEFFRTINEGKQV